MRSYEQDRRILDRVARAIWDAVWEEPYPDAGTIQHAIAENMAKAAISAMAEEILGS